MPLTHNWWDSLIIASFGVWLENNKKNARNATQITASVVINVDTGRYTRGPFYHHGLTLTAAYMDNNIPSNVCYEITYPFPNFNSNR